MLGSARILRKVLSVWTEWLTCVTDALGAWFAPGWCTKRTLAKTVIIEIIIIIIIIIVIFFHHGVQFTNSWSGTTWHGDHVGGQNSNNYLKEFTWKWSLVSRGKKCFFSLPPTWPPWRHVQTSNRYSSVGHCCFSSCNTSSGQHATPIQKSHCCLHILS